jgi:hypothetical protein
MKRNVYGNSTDLANAQRLWGGLYNGDYNYINTEGLDPSQYKFGANDIVLGGTQAQGGIGDVNLNGAQRLWGADSAATNAALSGYKDYQNLAEDIISPTYNYDVSAINNALNRKISSLNQSKQNVNQNYDTAVENQNRQNIFTQNNFSNQQGARGMGRSSITTTGLAGMDDTNNRIVANINNSRKQDLGNIDMDISNLQSATADELKGLELDKNRQLASTIMQMQQRDEDIAWRNKQYEDSQKQYTDEQNWRQKMFDNENDWKQKEYDNSNYWKQKDYEAAAASRAASAAKASGSSLTSTDIKNIAYDQFYKHIDAGDIATWLANNRSNIIKDIGEDAYTDMVKKAQPYTDRAKANYINGILDGETKPWTPKPW